MKLNKLSRMTRGWFVGNFEPTIFKTDAAEAGIKSYKAGDNEKSHCHKIATEITTIVSGKVEMNGKTFSDGDIILIEPGEYTDFKSITDSVTVVVKVPCVKGDKYEKH
jgi:quercetin dioxygenase-like cupin family protein